MRISVLSHLIGRVRFEGEGGFPERLLSDAAAAGLPLSDTQKRAEVFSATCPARVYRHLRPLARRACMRLHITRKRGIYFRLFPYRRRLGIPVGLVLAALLLSVLSGRIWVVQPVGNAVVSDAVITDAVAALGVYPGCRIAAVDMEILRIRALDALPELVHISVNPHGCVARVAVTEREMAPDIQNFKEHVSNLVAAREGRILATEIYSGQAAVAVGDGVAAGMLLVSGAVESASGNTVLRRAAGKILAETTHTLSVTVPYTEKKLLPDGNTLFRPSMRFLKWEIPLFGSAPLTGPYAVEEFYHLPRRGEITLPIGFVHRRYARLRETAVVHTSEEARDLAEKRLAERMTALTAEGVTIKKEITRKESGAAEGYTLTVSLLCEEDIAREVPLKIAGLS